MNYEQLLEHYKTLMAQAAEAGAKGDMETVKALSRELVSVHIDLKYAQKGK